jgi:hypothetical protein
MHREDTSCFVLYIEPRPEDKSIEPIDDELTRKVEAAVAEAVKGTAAYDNLKAGFGHGSEFFSDGNGYRGFHLTPDREIAISYDLLLPNGLITNAAAVHYVRWYRRAIPDCDMKKLATL